MDNLVNLIKANCIMSMVIGIIVTAIIVYLYMAREETFVNGKKESFVGASQLDPVNEMAKLIDGGGCGGCGGCGCGSVVGGSGGCVGGGCVGGGCRK